MSKAVFLQQASYIGPGRIVPVFRDFGIPCEIRHVYRGDEVPTDLDELRILVVLDGPMRVADASGENAGKFPFLSKEIETLQRLVAADRPVLGIGLGAQLLAHAAGAKVYPNAKPGAKPEDPATPMPEYGWGPVTFPFPGGTEPIVYGLNDGCMMFHWHADTFDLPRLPPPANPAPPAPPPPTGNALLSSSRTTKNQAFRFKTRLFGFQYHMELTADGVEAIASNDPGGASHLQGGAEALREETKKHYPRYARLGDRVLQNFVQFLKTYDPPR
jgi:GMP synthase (glutamine-hydrolysing)